MGADGEKVVGRMNEAHSKSRGVSVMAKRKVPEYAFEQFWAVRRCYGVDFSPDGAFVAYVTDISGQLNLWKQPVDGGYPTQLIVFDDQTVRQFAWRPQGDFIFNADFQGNELYQIYRLPPTGIVTERLTDRDEVRHEFGRDNLSEDGRFIAYASNANNPMDMDVFVRDLKTGETRCLTKGGGIFFPNRFSPNNRFLLVTRINSTLDTDLFLCDLRNGELTHLTPHDGYALYFAGDWLPDGSGFLVVTDEGREFKGLAIYRLKERKFDWLETPEWDVEDIALSPDGHVLAWTVNEDGISRLYLRDLKRRRFLPTPPLSDGLIGNLHFSPDSGKLAFYFEMATHPEELFVWNLRTKRLAQLTHNFLGGIPEGHMVNPKLVRYKSFDGRRIPAWVFIPHGASSANKVPVVISPHGGPEWQERPWYSAIYQFLLNRGIAIFAPNFRGSTGYGKSYQKLIWRDWGGGELQDIEHAALWLQKQAWVDKERIAIFGGSFGGFATLSAVTRLPQYWRCGVDLCGPSNLITFLQTVPPFWKHLTKQLVGDPDEDREFLLSRSPITYVDNVRCPLLVLQGANDPRVVKAESDQMVERLRERSVPVEYVVFEDEGHGLTKRANMLKAARLISEFLLRNLKS